MWSAPARSSGSGSRHRSATPPGNRPKAASAEPGRVLHGARQALLQERLSDHREAVLLGFPARHHDHPEILSRALRFFGELVAAHLRHVDIGNQYLEALVARQQIEGK